MAWSFGDWGFTFGFWGECWMKDLSERSPLPTCAKSVLRGPAVLIKRLIRVGLPAGLFTACPFAGHWLLRAVYSLTPFLPLPLERLGRSCHYAGDKRVISDSLEQTSDDPATH